MRVVLDTNVLVSGFFFAGVPGRILDAWKLGEVRLILSASILAEYRETGAELERAYGGSDFEAFAALLVLNSDVIEAPESLSEQVCSDPDDDKFLACAVAAGTAVVISGDRALLAVSGWNGVEVINPRTFVDKYLKD